MDEGTEQKINRLSMLEQNSGQLASQRQGFQAQLAEAESALQEIKSASDAYKIIGNIMIKADKGKLGEELSSRRKLLESRIKSLEKHESSLREKAKSLQQEVMKELESKKQAGQKK